MECTRQRGKFEGLSTSVLLFSSGNGKLFGTQAIFFFDLTYFPIQGVITGAKNEMEIVHTFNLVYDVVNGYFGEKVRLYLYDFFCLVSSRKFVFSPLCHQ